MSDTGESNINWRLVYGVVLVWLVVMIVIMRLFSKVFS